MTDLNDLRLFVKVVELGGFSAAARQLGLPRSRLSRRIGLLEDDLRVRLIQRTTRQFAVTELGQEFYRHCVAMMIEADAALDVITRMQAEPKGTVRVSCAASVIYFQVGEMIARFMAKYPQVKVELESTNRRVDVIREGFDLAIRVRFPPLDDSDLVIRKLAESHQRLVASPKLIQEGHRPAPADLANMPGLAWGSSKNNFDWKLQGPNDATTKVPYEPLLITDDMVALRLAALQGIGICQFPTMVIDEDLKAGRLVDVLPGWAPRTGIIHAAFPSRRGLLPSVRALLDFLADEYTTLSAKENT
ncbi:DNA-binding transcriptional LysR family regulator [Ochrobactrum sp. 19YEA23]|uniref:LysR family transcriptional regulator n=1 Tax=Ochrobactrum sp. 19YEA23 TaxID=3039854 RepID=UPI00247B0C2D|nr:DNA-binding transcriptional LysR family regulator [Ochrobactrum sp. 19YEA23]